MHAQRERLVKVRTALANQLRGELAERGVVFGKKIGILHRGVVAFLEQAVGGDVTDYLQRWARERLDEWRVLDERIKDCEREMQHAIPDEPGVCADRRGGRYRCDYRHGDGGQRGGCAPV